MIRNVLLITILTLLCACTFLPMLNNSAENGENGKNSTNSTIRIVVNGIDNDVVENIRDHISMSRSACTVPVDLLRPRINKARTETTTALQALGYYEANIALELLETEDCPTLNINVEPGRRMSVDDVKIEITGDAGNDRLFMARLEKIPLNKGDPLNHGNYSKAKSLIESVATELGYLEGRFEHSVLTIDMENYAARISLIYNSGERYRLGDIKLTQNPKELRESLVNRLIEAPRGEYFNTREIIKIQERLSSSNYFKDVEVRPRLTTNEEKTIPVDVTVTPSDRHKVSASFGYASDEGFRGRLGYTDRRWNDRGHRLGGEIRLSQIERGLSANYQIPRKHPSNEWLQFTAGLRQEEVDTFDAIKGRISITESKRRPWGFLENRFISLSRDDFEIGGEDNSGTYLIPGLRWNRRVTDNDLYPQRGLDISIEARGGTEAIISDTSFARTHLHVHYLKGIGYGVRIGVRTDLGALWVDEFRALPPSERFFAGGDNSIRGYGFQDLGPVNDLGLVIGGKYLGVASLELEKRLFGKWGVATFVDTGNAFGGPGSNTGVKIGAGVGIRWLSPVGPVRLDMAHPFDDDTDTVIRFHIRIGTDI